MEISTVCLKPCMMIWDLICVFGFDDLVICCEIDPCVGNLVTVCLKLCMLIWDLGFGSFVLLFDD